MRKILLVIVMLAAGYTGAWFYVADKTKETVVMQLESLKGKDKSYQITYDEIKVSGYPLAIHVEIVSPRVQVAGVTNEQADASFVEANRIIFTPNLTGTKVAMTSVGDLRYSIKDKSESQTLRCMRNPSVTTVLDTSLLTTPIPDLNTLANHLKEVAYLDEACVIEDSETKEVISKSERTAIHLKVEKTNEKQQFDMSLDAKGVEHVDPDGDALKGFGKSNIDANVMLAVNVITDPASGKQTYKSADLNIKSLNYTAPRLAIAIAGSLNSTAASLMPTGSVRVKITHYENLVSSLAESFDLKNVDKINALLVKASDKTDNPDMVDINIKGDEAGISFGSVPFMEALQVIK